MRTHDRGSLLTAGTAVAVLLALALPARADESSGGEHARFRFGGSLALAAPTGEFARHVDVAGGLSGVALYGRPHSPLALRADAGWLLYGTRTLRRAIPGTDGRVLEDVATTDNWIAQVAVGPQLMARSGRIRPYANAFAGASYFATSSELARPRPSLSFVAPPGAPVVVVSQDPFRTTTHFDDAVASYGAGTGVLIGLGRGGTALDVGLRYVANGRVRFLAEGDPLDGTPRRSEGHLFEFRVGVLGLR
jgi:hypothetical protein